MIASVQLSHTEVVLLKQHYRKAENRLIRERAQALLANNNNFSFLQISTLLCRSEKTIREWVKAFQAKRIASIFTQYKGENAAKLTRTQKREIRKVLKKEPSDYGIPGAFWDVSNLKKYIYAEFGVIYESDETYRLIFKLHNYSFHIPATFDIHRDEEQIEKRMQEIIAEIEPLFKNNSWIVLAADECRIQWETEIRRAWLPTGRKTIINVEKKREAQSFLGLLNIQTGKEHLYRLDWQNQEEIIKALEKLIKDIPNKRICIIWDNARFHKGKKLREKLSTTLRRIHLINLPPYAPDYNPQEHVWQYGKEKLSNRQRTSLEETVIAFEQIITGRLYQYSF